MTGIGNGSPYKLCFAALALSPCLAKASMSIEDGFTFLNLTLLTAKK